MSDIIQLLPDSIANQIAAGEVVQRPASVVKELMENSVDSGAKHITVIVKDAGKTHIRIIDDGSGMSETDARMSLERHATSKIRKTEDLFQIRTMGFRGEALASIAAVSQMVVKTRTADNELGTLIEVESSKVKDQHPDPGPEGTSVTVKNLFYNIPARRNFLKSGGVEMRHIVDEFQRVAVGHPDVEFSFFQNDLETYNLPQGKLNQRILNIFGKNYQKQLVAVEENTQHISISGYVGKPEAARKTRGEQFFFVNKRFIKSGYLNHAIVHAYEGLISKEYFPFYVLFIEIDPSHIDVNIHPTKTEIKFDDERTVYGIIRAAIKQALGAHNISQSIDFDLDVNFGKDRRGQMEGISDKNYGQFRGSKPGKEEIENWEAVYKSVTDGSQKQGINLDEKDKIEITFPSRANTFSHSKELDSDSKTSSSAFIFLLHGKYVATQIKSGMMLVDIERAHERILFEKFLQNMESNPGLSQRTLFPTTLNMNPSDYSLLQDISEEIRTLGFDFDDFGNNCIVINGIPADLTFASEKTLIEGLIEQYKINSSELRLPKKEMIARAMARRSGLKPGSQLTPGEMNALIDNLFGCKNPNYTPSGQLTFFILDLNKIDQFFN